MSGNEYSGLMLFFADGNLALQTAGINHWPYNNGDIRDGNCHHVAVVRSSTSQFSWYVDGQLKSTDADADYDLTVPGGIIFGNDYASNLTVPINGTIQEMRFWDVARTQAQLQGSMNKQLTGNETGLIGYWRFNDGTGQVIADHSPTNNAGFLGSTISADINDPSFTIACQIDTLNNVVEVSPDNNNGIFIYPNPSNGNFTLSCIEPLHNATLNIFNQLGDQVFKIVEVSTNLEIQLSDLAKGIYLVQIRDEQRQYVQKIVVE